MGTEHNDHSDNEDGFRRNRDEGRGRERKRDEDRGRGAGRRDRYDERPSPRYDNRRRDYDRNDRRGYDDEYRGGRRDRFEDRRYERRDDYPRRDRRCDYCDRCPTHGTRSSFKEYPSDAFKIVIQDIPECTTPEVEDLCREKGLEPVYTRITRNNKFAIVEFKNHDEKNNALEKLDGAELNGTRISVREYRSQGNNMNDNREKRRKTEEDVDMYGDIEAEKTEKVDFDI